MVKPLQDHAIKGKDDQGFLSPLFQKMEVLIGDFKKPKEDIGRFVTLEPSRIDYVKRATELEYRPSVTMYVRWVGYTLSNKLIEFLELISFNRLLDSHLCPQRPSLSTSYEHRAHGPRKYNFYRPIHHGASPTEVEEPLRNPGITDKENVFRLSGTCQSYQASQRCEYVDTSAIFWRVIRENSGGKTKAILMEYFGLGN